MDGAAWRMPICLGPAAALAASAPAGGQGAECRLGLKASFAVPTEASFDLHRSYGDPPLDAFLSQGLSVAWTIEWGLGAKGAIRGKAEYMQFGGGDSRPAFDAPEGDHYLYVFQGPEYDMKMAGLGADCLCGFRAGGAGPYCPGRDRPPHHIRRRGPALTVLRSRGGADGGRGAPPDWRARRLDGRVPWRRLPLQQ